MKRFLGYLIVAAGILFLSAAQSTSARMGGFGGPGPGSAGHWGGGWHDDHFHGRPGFFFVGAFPFWYPYYGSPYYYYYYPPPYYYYDGYNYNYAPRYYYNSTPPVASENSAPPAYPTNDPRNYLVLGHDSGKALKLKSASWGWFVEYLQAYVVNAPSWEQDDFRRGFISGYGDDGESAYKKGFEQAQQPRPPAN